MRTVIGSVIALSLGMLLIVAFNSFREVPDFVGTIGSLLITISLITLAVAGIKRVVKKSEKDEKSPPDDESDERKKLSRQLDLVKLQIELKEAQKKLDDLTDDE